jgi:dihydroflavonol-4-reductase
MTVLVTGATGFVGSWLVRRLIERGDTVHVLHRKSSNLDDLAGLPFVSRLGDVTDPASVASAAQDVDQVYHLAGVVGYSRAMRPVMDKVNIGGTRNVVEAIRRSPRAPKLVYMSSVVAVGASFDGKPLNEESPYNVSRLNLGYFETKHSAELLVKEACREGHIQAVILNPSTIYGGGDAKKGSRKAQLKTARGKFPFYTRGGVSIVSVHDIVEALLAAPERGRNGERYILSGENITIKDLLYKIAGFAGAKPPSIFLPDAAVHAIGRVGDLMEKLGRKGPLNSENAWTSLLYHWFDHSKATRELGFNPRPADEALKESVDWMKQQGLLN